jgi:hypothetical protein
VTIPVTAALRAAAAGLHTDEAGTELLISHGCFLHRDDFTRYLHTAPSISDPATLLAWIDWDAALTALSHGQLPASGGEQRILHLAASLAAGHPVSLHDAIPGLDHRNLRLVTTAIRHAAGQHH